MLPVLVFSQDSPPVPVAPPIPQAAVIEPKLVPVYDPTPLTGPVAVEIHYAYIESQIKAKYPEAKVMAVSIGEDRLKIRNSKGQPIKLKSLGVGTTAKGQTDIELTSGVFYFYLPEASSELPEIILDTQWGPVVICKAKVDPEIDPAILPKRGPIQLLGFQPAAQLLSGGTGAAYQLALDLPLSERFKIDGLLSSSFLDKQALVNFGARPGGSLAFDLTTNQLGTNQLLRIGSEAPGQIAPLPTKNYKGQLSHPARGNAGVYFAKQLRLDDRISGGASAGSGFYASGNLGFQNFNMNGFSSYFINLGVYLFPGASADQFGVNSFEFAYDFGTIFPLARPSKTRAGYADDGYFLKLGLLGGVQPGNGFGYVQGLRFDIVRSF